MSDAIQKCLSLTPVPHLEPAFSAFPSIWSIIQQAKASKEQLETLAQSIAELLFTLDNEYRAKRLLKERADRRLAGLSRFVIFAVAILGDVYLYRIASWRRS
jgi:hypothetical protein